MPTYFNENTQTWYCKFYYRDFMGKNHQKKKGGFQLQKDAREWEKSFIRQHEGGPDMTFSELYEIYERDMQNRLRYSTMFTKRHLIKTKLLPYLGDLPINKIQPCTIREWQNLMRSHKDENGKGYSETYLKSMNNQLSAILNYAVRYYHLTANPCHAAGSMGKKQVSHSLFWSPDEFHAFLNYFPNDSGRWLVFSILYYTGIRIGDDDDKIRLNQRKPSKYKGLSRFGPEKNLQRINKFMKERPIFYKNLIQMKENFRFYLRCFYCITKVVILQFNRVKQDRISS